MADVMRLAYQLAVRNEIKKWFCKRNEKAGRKWLKNFLSRHPQISVRIPEGFSLSRARGFTPESVAQFFLIYKPAMDTIQHNPARLYNCDETGITILQHKRTKILVLKGKRQITSLQSAERGFLVTVVTCMSPIGPFIPLLLVFKEKILKKNWWVAHRLDQATRAIPRGGYRARFFPSGFFISSNIHSRQKKLLLS